MFSGKCRRFYAETATLRCYNYTYDIAQTIDHRLEKFLTFHHPYISYRRKGIYKLFENPTFLSKSV